MVTNVSGRKRAIDGAEQNELLPYWHSLTIHITNWLGHAYAQ